MMREKRSNTQEQHGPSHALLSAYKGAGMPWLRRVSLTQGKNHSTRANARNSITIFEGAGTRDGAESEWRAHNFHCRAVTTTQTSQLSVKPCCPTKKEALMPRVQDVRGAPKRRGYTWDERAVEFHSKGQIARLGLDALY